ncbi:MAG TPA: NAD(P)H-dependent oxidoreductase subunit E [Bacteroidota bacterium]|nr:NAD(P)H-dependent oxidoreductase subunit E [Bacteroidota bacterium]
MFNNVCKILEEYQHKKNNLVPILQAVQEEYHYLPEDVLRFVAASLQLPVARVFGVATFYAHFALEPKGKYIIKVCNGTACHVKDSISLLDTVREILKLHGEQKTTDDMLFTLETVSCLGACGLAPVVVVNEEVHSLMTPQKTETLLKNIMASEKELAA